MKTPSHEVKDAISRLRNTPDFDWFVGWLKDSREELRGQAEMPVTSARDFSCGGAAVLSEILQAIQRR